MIPAACISCSVLLPPVSPRMACGRVTVSLGKHCQYQFQTEQDQSHLYLIGQCSRPHQRGGSTPAELNLKSILLAVSAPHPHSNHTTLMLIAALVSSHPAIHSSGSIPVKESTGGGFVILSYGGRTCLCSTCTSDRY